jgi:hypothetical protein
VWRSEVEAPLILNLAISWRPVVIFSLWSLHRGRGCSPTLPIGQGAGWAPQPTWTQWRREYYCSRRKPNPGRPARSHSPWRLKCAGWRASLLADPTANGTSNPARPDPEPNNNNNTPQERYPAGVGTGIRFPARVGILLFAITFKSPLGLAQPPDRWIQLDI